MSLKLSDEDGRAVDVLLDGPVQHRETNAFVAGVSNDFDARVDHARKLLATLGTMPAAEPPVDLIRRTMRRIEEAGLVDASRQSPAAAQAAVPNLGPVA